MATPEQWDKVETWHYRGDPLTCCIIELRDRLAALEAQQQQPASPEPTQRTEPEVQRELWDQMGFAWGHASASNAHCVAAEIDAVAKWLEQRGRHTAAADLRYQARRARREA